jgi:SAM-dependent methyltransferase
MMDHIYFRNKFMNEFQGTGAKIYAYTSDTAGPRAIRRRREIIAHRIDEIASRTKGIKVLSMAAGHLREVELSRAFESGAIAEWVALDHDEESLEEVVRSYGDGPCIRTIGLSVRRMLQERITLGEFDLVYASGLYDYLGQPVAKLLTENLFAQLKPGGVLVISNFLPGILDVGFMETYMDWRLIFRDKAAMEDLSLSLPQDLLAHQRCFTEESGNIIFLELTRR